MLAHPGRKRGPRWASLVVLGLVAGALAGCSSSATEEAAGATLPPPAAASPTTVVSSAPAATAQPTAVQAILESATGEWLGASGTVGAVVAAVLPDGSTIASTAGWADRELETSLELGANFRIGSITKVYTATLIMQLAEEGRLTLTDSVQQYVPGAPPAMTIAQLLGHTSGLRDVDVAAGIIAAIQNPEEVAAPEDTISSALQAPLAFEPGSRQSYSSIGYLVLERVVEAATGESYEAALQERILAPFRLDATGLESEATPLPTPYERLSPNGPQISLAPISTTNLARAAGAAGGLVAPADEVTAFAAALFDGRILAPESLMAMMDVSGGTLVDYGLGLALYQVAGDLRFGHNGRTIGFASSLRHSPAKKITVVVLSNDGSAPTDELADILVDKLAAAVGS